MTSHYSKLLTAAAFGFAAAFFGATTVAWSDQIYFTGKDHSQEHHVANIGNGHTEHTVRDRETHLETHFHEKNGIKWVTQGKIGGPQKVIAGTPVPPGPQKSDIRLKRDIVELGRLDNGIGLYRFRYNWSNQVYVGVMAQEVATVVPEAVSSGPDGYLRVDYGRLGLTLQTWAEWAAAHGDAPRGQRLMTIAP